MPKALHRALEKRAEKMGLKGKEKDAYVYGTMHKSQSVGPAKGKGQVRHKPGQGRCGKK